MRKEKKIEIEISAGLKREVTIYEVRVYDLINLIESEKIRNTENNCDDIIEILLPLCITLEKDEFYQLYPSDMKMIWDTFREVNTFFFEGVNFLNKMPLINHWINQLVIAFQNDMVGLLGNQLPDLSGQGTEMPGNTDGDSSLTPSEN